MVGKCRLYIPTQFGHLPTPAIITLHHQHWKLVWTWNDNTSISISPTWVLFCIELEQVGLNWVRNIYEKLWFWSFAIRCLGILVCFLNSQLSQSKSGRNMMILPPGSSVLSKFQCPNAVCSINHAQFLRWQWIAGCRGRAWGCWWCWGASSSAVFHGEITMIAWMDWARLFQTKPNIKATVVWCVFFMDLLLLIYR